jgi:uncharacterized protein YcaQ
MNEWVDDVMQLSVKQARKAVLLSQRLYAPAASGSTAVHEVIEKLGYIQIDSISVLQRAHHHTLWSRVKGYEHAHLESLEAEKKVFEYWSHAAAYLPMRDYRFSLPRKHAIASGDRHWHDKDHTLEKAVLQRIQTEGPLQAKDFEHKRSVKNTGWWDWKPAKKALEQLFMEGELMVLKRQGFQKVYDLTERVLPENVNTSAPSPNEYHQHLITQFLRAQGLARYGEIAYQLTGIKSPVRQCCLQMLEDGKLIKVQVGQQEYYALPDIEALLAQSLSRSKVKILSPFDNLVIQRKRTENLFDFNYQIECYVPAAKRQYGYFSLPLLWGDTFAGRMDAKIDRKTAVLHINNLHIETKRPEAFLNSLKPSLNEFLAFNQGQHIQLHKISGNTLSSQEALLLKQIAAELQNLTKA